MEAFTEDQVERNRRRMARTWLRNTPNRFRIVQEAFRHLGYEELKSACERAGAVL